MSTRTRGPVGREADARREAVRVAGGGEQPLGLRGIVPVVLGALAELPDGQRPLRERGGHRAVDRALPLEHRVDHALAIHRQRDGLPHADVVERRLVRPHVDGVHHVGGIFQGLQIGAALLQRLGDLHPVRPVDRARKLPAEIVLAAEERGDAGGIVLVDEHLHPVDIRQAGDEVGGIAHQGDRDVRLVAVEHPRAGADHRLRLLQVAELLDALLGDDGARHRVGDHVEEPGEGLLQREPHRVLVDRLDLRDGAVHRHVDAALVGQDALVRVADVLRRQLAAVDRRLGVKAHALLELEDVASCRSSAARTPRGRPRSGTRQAARPAPPCA